VRSGFEAVVVPFGFRTSVQPHRWDDDLVVIGALKEAILEAGVAAVGFVLDVVDLAGRSGLVAAAGPPAPPVAQDDRVADAGRNGLGVPDVQGQARPGQLGSQLPSPQERGSPPGPDSRSAAFPMMA
jgi:hypothetical protein